MAAIVDLDTASPALRALLARASNRPGLNKVISVAGTRAVKDRFAEVATWMRNKFGRPAQFWKRMSRATRPEATAAHAAVVMPREVAQRYFGGTIRPTGGRNFLTIPARAEAYRRSARSFDDLVLIVFRRKGRGPAGALIRKGETHDAVMYWLYRKVTQKGDPRVLPTSDELAAAVMPDVESYLLRDSKRTP